MFLCFLAVPRFRQCCSHAYSSALALAARCSGAKESFIDASYRRRCNDSDNFIHEFEVPPEDQEEGVENSGVQDVANLVTQAGGSFFLASGFHDFALHVSSCCVQNGSGN